MSLCVILKLEQLITPQRFYNFNLRLKMITLFLEEHISLTCYTLEKVYWIAESLKRYLQ